MTLYTKTSYDGDMRIFAGLILVLAVTFLSTLIGEALFERWHVYPEKIEYGVTFSPGYAKYLKLDWRQTFIKILDEDKVKNLRLPTYWEDIEERPSEFDFSEPDFLISEAEKRRVKIMLVLGIRQPRWPECHVPSWAKALTVDERQKKLLQFISRVVDRYRDNPQVWAWQVENEPTLPFGDNCDKPDQAFLKKEGALVRGLSDRKIIMTDSGELGFWTTSMQLSDIFGTTLYRDVYDKRLGYVTYPVPPFFYSLKSVLIRNLFAPKNQKTIIVELQAEPWLAGGNFVPINQQATLFKPSDFKNYLEFSKKTGFDEAYLWGVEWWYFMAEHGHPEYLDYAKTVFR